MPALAIPLIIGAGAKVYGAVKQAGAAKDAAKQQAAAADRAMAIQQSQYLQSRQDLTPYREQGGQGLTALTALMGLPPTAPQTNTGPLMPPGQPPVGTPQSGQRGPLPPGATPTGYAVPRGTTPGIENQGMTLLRSPDGQIRPVPSDQVQHYLARGATLAPVQR